jgi:hypothetical protein
VSRRLTPAAVVLAALLVTSATLVVVELGMGGASAGSTTLANPCEARAPFPGGGIDATIQRVVLDGLDGAACRLHTTREELVLSLGRSARGEVRNSERQKIEAAVRAGLLRAVDEADRRGDIPGFLAPVLRRVVESVPLDELIRGAISLRDLIG